VLSKPFPRLGYREAIARYGTDKPDLRFGMEIADATDIFAGSTFGTFARVAASGGGVRAIAVPGAAAWTRSQLKKYEVKAKRLGAGGLFVVAPSEGSVHAAAAKYFSAAESEALVARTGAGPEDLLWLVADASAERASRVLGGLRSELGTELGLKDPNVLAWGWITDFPMFERDEATGRVDFSHNPFSMPKGGLEALETSDPVTIDADQYDLFCNGLELSSGAVRNYSPAVMYKAFEIAGYARSDVDARFGHMIDAFRLGAPPHAGIAPGIERLVMLMAGEPNLREVMAFPKNGQCRDLMLGAPSRVTDEQLGELHIAVVALEE
jgi:aspartyl-tRNA synthetase